MDETPPQIQPTCRQYVSILLTLPSGKISQKEKGQKRKAQDKNLIFYSAVNAVGGNAPKPALPVQGPPPKIRTEPF